MKHQHFYLMSFLFLSIFACQTKKRKINERKEITSQTIEQEKTLNKKITLPQNAGAIFKGNELLLAIKPSDQYQDSDFDQLEEILLNLNDEQFAELAAFLKILEERRNKSLELSGSLIDKIFTLERIYRHNVAAPEGAIATINSLFEGDTFGVITHSIDTAAAVLPEAVSLLPAPLPLLSAPLTLTLNQFNKGFKIPPAAKKDIIIKKAAKIGGRRIKKRHQQQKKPPEQSYVAAVLTYIPSTVYNAGAYLRSFVVGDVAAEARVILK